MYEDIPNDCHEMLKCGDKKRKAAIMTNTMHFSFYGRTLINGTFLRKACGRNINIFVTFYNFLFTRIRSEIQMILMLRIMILAAALNNLRDFENYQ